MTFSVNLTDTNDPVLLEVDMLCANSGQNPDYMAKSNNNPLVRGLVRTNLSMPAFGVVSEVTNNVPDGTNNVPGGTNFTNSNPGVSQSMILGDPIQVLMGSPGSPVPIAPPSSDYTNNPHGPDGIPQTPCATTGYAVGYPNALTNGNGDTYQYWDGSWNAAVLSHIKVCLPPIPPSDGSSNPTSSRLLGALPTPNTYPCQE